MIRNRLEDIGRIYEIGIDTVDMNVFELVDTPKWFLDRFYQKDKEQQEEIIRSLAYGVKDIEEKLFRIISIARGDDDLNYAIDTERESQC